MSTAEGREGEREQFWVNVKGFEGVGNVRLETFRAKTFDVLKTIFTEVVIGGEFLSDVTNPAA